MNFTAYETLNKVSIAPQLFLEINLPHGFSF